MSKGLYWLCSLQHTNSPLLAEIYRPDFNMLKRCNVRLHTRDVLSKKLHVNVLSVPDLGIS